MGATHTINTMVFLEEHTITTLFPDSGAAQTGMSDQVQKSVERVHGYSLKKK